MLGLMTPKDAEVVQTLLSMPGGDITSFLTINTILLDSIGGHAEALVVARLGSDWPLFLPGAPTTSIPLSYAQGNQTLAVSLVHDALVQFSCATVIDSGLLQQSVATTKQTAKQKIEYAIDWPTRKDAFVCRANEALNMLIRPSVLSDQRPTMFALATGRRGR